MKEAMHFKVFESNSFWLELDMSWFWINIYLRATRFRFKELKVIIESKVRSLKMT